MKAGENIETGVGVVLGLAEDGVGYAVDENNQPLLDDAMLAAVEDAKAKIISGELEVASYYATDSCPAIDF
jgi:basic membrane protein A